jgi:hypothetical protein
MHGLGGKPVCVCKRRGVQFDTMLCLDCQLQFGLTNRGAKEKWFFNAMAEHDDVRLHISERNRNRVLGRSRRYPDGIIFVTDASGKVLRAVIVELDEFAHKDYGRVEEDARLQLLYEDLVAMGISLLHVMRFNPDQKRVSLISFLERLVEVLDSGVDAELAYLQCDGVAVGDKRPFVEEFHGYSPLVDYKR